MRPETTTPDAAARVGPKARFILEIVQRLAGPIIAFVVTLARIVLGPALNQDFLVPLVLAAVVAGATFGGRWSALATVAIAAVGLALALTGETIESTAVAILAAVAIALTTGELRDRAERSERELDVANQRLRRLALRDTLTGLLDRRGFELALGIEIAREGRRGGRFAVALLEATVTANARFGRSVQDTILQVFGDSIEQRIRQSDIAARVGDREFAVILPDADERGAEVVARAILGALDSNLRGILPSDLAVGATFGIARFPEDGRGADVLLGAAARARREAS